MKREMIKKVVIIPIILIPILVMVSSSMNLQEGKENVNEEWNKTFGGNYNDKAEWVVQTNDGGYIIAGYTGSYGAGDLDSWIIKTDPNGNEIWNKSFGGKKEDVAYCVREVNDGGYVVTGYSRSFGNGREDVWLIKTDENGNEEWNKTFGGKEGEYALSVIQAKDGGYVIVGNTESYGAGDKDIWLIKTDENGNEEWNKTFGGRATEFGNYVIQTRDGRYVVGGETESYGHGKLDIWLIKTDENGNEEWNKTFGGSSMDRGEDVIQTKDGGYAITGESRPHITVWDDVFLIKTSENGNMEWIKSFEGIHQDLGYSIIQTNDGYLIGGTTHSYGASALANFKAWLIKTDKGGNEQWNKTFGKRGRESADCIIQASDGSYIFVGGTDSYGAGKEDAWLVKCQDYPPPKIKIVKPRKGWLYIFDRKIIPIGKTIILGGITVKVEGYDSEEKINRVEFYLDTPEAYEREPRAIIYEPPYEWKWDEPAIGPCLITSAAYYGNTEAHAADIINLWIFNI
ncbi:MAG: hypothetical protein U9O96_06665 [Candidatus Thermoplasmatota archaeon]|nr:hypothetical protein [Candidatus Thermoplasmatota archaeon]